MRAQLFREIILVPMLTNFGSYLFLHLLEE